MGHMQGRRFMHRLLASGGIWRDSFSTEALIMARNEGRRAFALQLLGEVLEQVPERYNEMMKEQRDDRRERRSG